MHNLESAVSFKKWKNTLVSLSLVVDDCFFLGVCLKKTEPNYFLFCYVVSFYTSR